MIRVLFGDDEYAVSIRARELQRQSVPDDLLLANVSVFEGDRINVDELLTAAYAAPFLADRRVVIVRGLLGRIENPGGGRRGAPGPERLKSDAGRLAEGLKTIPSSTDVVFVEGPLRRNGAGLRAAGSSAEAEEFHQKRGADLLNWISRRFIEENARASPAAASRLAELVGENTRLLDQEIRKLATYAGSEAIQREHVEMLVAPAREASIFAAVDAILERRLAPATRLLYQLLASGASVQSIMALIAAQVRRVLIAQELVRIGLHDSDRNEFAARLGLRPGFAVTKTIEQARRFPAGYLEGTMRSLLAADLAIKSGEMDERLALELLAARLASATDLAGQAGRTHAQGMS
ncbi:MAG: DNA polymerase III subunit delta [Chloroflexi bacterium]|nr:DNA polymerase III subunit delta [Chloroflexota bacterium]